MLENPIKEKLARGQAVYGVILDWPSQDILEFCGHLGFEWAFIDAEHGSIGRETCAALVRACNLVGMVPVVRVPENNASVILGYLETGALGIIVPHINTAEDARRAVEAIKYAPIGKRGAGSTSRVANYGLTQTPREYFQRANESVIVSLLVEEIEGLGNLDQILAVEGVDVVGIGPGDLSMTLGLPGQYSHPEVRRLVDDAEARVVAAKGFTDATVKDFAEARRTYQIGARMIGVSIKGLLGSAGRQFLAEMKQPGSG